MRSPSSIFLCSTMVGSWRDQYIFKFYIMLSWNTVKATLPESIWIYQMWCCARLWSMIPTKISKKISLYRHPKPSQQYRNQMHNRILSFRRKHRHTFRRLTEEWFKDSTVLSLLKSKSWQRTNYNILNNTPSTCHYKPRRTEFLALN